MLNDSKLTDNPLSISWHDSAWIPVLNPHNVMDYFSERSNPFYDRTCSNEVVKMQRVSPEQMVNMQGTEYCLLHVQEPILYVIRKQHRHSPTQVTPLTDYYIIAGIVYQAPDLGSVLNSRILTTVNHLQSAFDEAKSYAKYHPSRGYWWDFGPGQVQKKKSKTPAGPSTEESGPNAGKKAKKRPALRKETERKAKEEPSSIFQRRRVDMILDLITRKFPPKLPTTVPTASAATATNVADKETSNEIKLEKDVIKTENTVTTASGVKREATPNKNTQPDAKRLKTN
ncbi:hypothetical protein TCAL_01407 [Tigriopus californicus]|uniref:Mediator of RNA polymerase II transcription subunit 6 n=1 Tax=Tigriopus californicus TaxID=6832 RepID=A0A553NSF4_TIGCA|nr:mediator of RNA polymerase II transcription subunit 6-like [Tigriopus californicus]TRY68340.1 hypothetical protein TCAL_01407 [Tigriopus californicus]